MQLQLVRRVSVTDLGEGGPLVLGGPRRGRPPAADGAVREDSDRIRTLIPIESERRFRGFRTPGGGLRRGAGLGRLGHGTLPRTFPESEESAPMSVAARSPRQNRLLGGFQRSLQRGGADSTTPPPVSPPVHRESWRSRPCRPREWTSSTRNTKDMQSAREFIRNLVALSQGHEKIILYDSPARTASTASSDSCA